MKCTPLRDGEKGRPLWERGSGLKHLLNLFLFQGVDGVVVEKNPQGGEYGAAPEDVRRRLRVAHLPAKRVDWERKAVGYGGQVGHDVDGE